MGLREDESLPGIQSDPHGKSRLLDLLETRTPYSTALKLERREMPHTLKV
jgi:hypothetical protein